MSASIASASAPPPPPRPAPEERILICGVNWLGDGVMTMPALDALRRARPGAAITILVRPWLRPLWELFGRGVEIACLAEGAVGTCSAARSLAARAFRECYVFPNSFRSALIPFLARVPARVGATGHDRAWMLTRAVAAAPEPGREHQMFEYFRILGLPAEAAASIRAPLLRVPDALRDSWRSRLGERGAGGRPVVALLPGAARGPAKRWPSEWFAEAGRRLAQEDGALVLVLGSEAEREAAVMIESAAGASCVNLAGATTLPDLAAVLSLCSAVVANDSGGMHLAAAVGSRVVGIFGATDPRTTGPLGEGHRVLAAAGVERSRDVPRSSVEAEAALRAVTPGQVVDAVRGVQANRARP